MNSASGLSPGLPAPDSDGLQTSVPVTPNLVAARTRMHRLELVFHEALQLPAHSRPEFVRAQCAEDATMMAEVLTLLASESAVSDLMSATGPLTAHRFLERDPAHDRERDSQADRWVGQVLGGFTLESLLGRGGMGVVYRASRLKNGLAQRVAVKLMARQLESSPARTQFFLERDTLARLEHPHIARLVDGGFSSEGLPYVVMEYVEGERLDLFSDEPSRTLPEITRLMLQLCDAVSYVHRNLILHRDLKPGNVMVSAEGNVKLLDFGTLKGLGVHATGDSMMTQAGMRSMTLRYASPEHIRGGAPSTAIDVYSLGMMLYRLLAGRLPEGFEDLSIPAYLTRLEQHPAAAPTAGMQPARKRADAQLAADLDAITLRAIRFSAADRYPSADALAADLARARDGRPVLARSGTARYRAARFLGRHRTLAIGTAAAALVLGVGVAAMAHQAAVARAESARANTGVDEEMKLAHLLLFDYFDELRKIPGSTGAQRQAVTQALDYLDRLSATTPRADVSLETVRAYTAMGTLLGSPYYQNLGDAEGALRTLQKALPLAASLTRSDPGNVLYQQAQTGVQMALGQVYMGSGKAKLAVDYLKPASETSWRLANQPGASFKTVMAAATPLGLLGDDYSQRGSGTLHDPQKATEAYQRAREINLRGLALDPACGRCKRGLAITLTKLGQLASERDVQAAEAEYRRGLQVLNTMTPAEKATMPVQRSFGTLRLALVELDLFTGRTAAAGPLLAEERAKSQKAIDADPLDARARFDLAAVDSTVFDAYLATKDYKNALDSSSRYLVSANVLARLEPDNVTWKLLHASALLSHGKALVETGQRPRGLAECDAGMEILLPIARSEDATADALGTASQYLVYLHRDAARDGPLAVLYAQRAMAGSPPSADQLLLLAEAQRFNRQPAESKVSARSALALLEATPNGLGHAASMRQAGALLAQ